MGDPAGIGLDIALATAVRPDAASLPAWVMLADADAVAERATKLGLRIEVRRLKTASEAGENDPGIVCVLPVRCAVSVEPGRPNSANAAATIRSIELATELVRSGVASAIVTNPIAKHVLQNAGFPHPGHTEFLGELALRYWAVSAAPVMMLAASELKVVPVTVHVALAKVPALLTAELIIVTARTTLAALVADFGIANPRLAVCGLNPHAGENGLMGSEDEAIIRPAVEALRAEGHSVTGPHPADTLFHAAARANYDAALAMYHDQGLIPIKTLAFDTGVNVTLGLPFVRTSPDHGTAFNIAGAGTASANSFVAALRLAADMAKRRRSGQVA